ncbi:AraC family transcriptional regulator [Aquimarina macrocephali]|uniref:AraC family transcriptional regulator n=1 Tax=Aquimarina macrocephali TaxID=666563 RepID=UPI001268CD4F|nr:AraC family transcriptional regulator [Aquimarina macrocephali]
MNKKDEYVKRMQSTALYLRENFNKNFEIKKLEEVSNFSYRNLQRIFKGYYKETIGAYITRLKIESGAKMLLYQNQTISQIAIEVGYSDLQAFSKAFKKHFGISPQEYKSKKEDILTSIVKNTKVAMSFYEERIINLSEQKVFYKTIMADYYSDKIENVWDELHDEAIRLEMNISESESIGIIWDEPLISEAIRCNYDACFTLPQDCDFKNKFSIKILPEQTYAVFTHYGSYASLQKTYDKIFGNWILSTKYEVSESPFLELYKINSMHSDDPKDYVTEIYIPVK